MPPRERLLAASLAIDPRHAQATLDLFRAALQARHDALAVAVARHVVRNIFEESSFSPWTVEAFLSGSSDADRVAMARGLAEAHQRLGNLRAAQLFFQIAQYLQPQDPVRRSLDALRARLDLEMKNDARRPVIGDGLEQDRLVHPKVSSR